MPGRFVLYWILSYILGSPLLALLILVALYFIIDRRFIGLLPDFTRAFKRRRRVARLEDDLRLNPSNASALAELGELRLARGEAAQAMSLLERAHERSGDSARLLLLLGSCYRKLGRDEEALSALEQAVALNGKVGYGEPYFHLLAIALKNPNPDSARVEELTDGVLRYGSAEFLYRSGREFQLAGNRAQARAMYQEALDSYQACPRALRKLQRRWATLSRLAMAFGS